jgi:malate dehydrogenase
MERKSLKICVTGAAGQISYAFLPVLASGQVFGENVSLHITLLDIPEAFNAMDGIKMELNDGLFPCVEKIDIGSDPKMMFKDADWVICLGGKPRQPGMERKDLLEINSKIFKAQGQALNEVAKSTCKVVVVANPCNTNCLMLQKYCPKLPKKNFTCLNRLDHNRAVAAIAQKTGVQPHKVKNVIVWGNHIAYMMYPDASFTTINEAPLDTVIEDKTFLSNDFITQVQKRAGEISTLRKKSAIFSAALAIKDHIRDWYFGTQSGEWVSMGVYSDGSNYDVPEGIFFSFPTICKDGEFDIVKGLQISEMAKEKIKICVEDLVEERNEALEDSESV